MNKFLQSVRQSAKIMSLLIKSKTVVPQFTSFLYTDSLRNSLSSNTSKETPQEEDIHTVDNDQGKVDESFVNKHHKNFISFIEQLELERIDKEKKESKQPQENPHIIRSNSKELGRG